jgi:hypothetical protein
VSDVNQTKPKRGVASKLAAYALAGAISGALAGAVLGLIGDLLSSPARAALATLLALAAVVLGGLELAGRRVPLIQADRETPYAWMERDPLLWAIRNGAALGFGARSRLGFWLWYAIPVGALLSASPLLGAVGYGLYGLTRTLAAGGVLFLELRNPRSAADLLRKGAAARRLTSAQLMAIGLATILIVGA